MADPKVSLRAQQALDFIQSLAVIGEIRRGVALALRNMCNCCIVGSIDPGWRRPLACSRWRRAA
jgi:hypothetical protein